MSTMQNEPVTGNTRKDQIEGLYPLSGLQQGMLFHGLYDGKVGAYLEQFGCDLIGADIDVFTRSWDYIIKFHTILRSAFYYDKFNVPVQCVFKEIKLPVEVLDYSSMSSEEQQSAIKSFEQSDKEKGFDFKSAPLMRLALIRLDDNRYHMHWLYHHIIMDGWSMPILIEDFLNIYEQLSKGEKIEFKEVDRYEDYIRYIERRDKKKEQLYWENYLKNLESGTLIPFIGKTTERTKGLGKYSSLTLSIDAATTAEVKAFAQKNRITVNTLMQGIWSYLLHCYTGKPDVLFGVIVSGRPDDLSNVERRVGMYINTLPLYMNIEKDKGIDEWLIDLQKEQVLMRQHQHTPLSNIIEWTNMQGGLFDSLLVFENYPVSKIVNENEWNLKVENVAINEHNNYPLSIVVVSNDQISIRFSYNTALLQKGYIEKISGHFENVLRQIVKNVNGEISDLNLITGGEEHELLSVFNNRETAYPKNKTIVDLFAQEVSKAPNNNAIVFEREKLSYKELNERSNQLANYLKRKNVAAASMIPLSVERGPNMMVGILGILKAGCAYVPIDPTYPEDRIKFMLEDTAANIIVSSEVSIKKLPNLSGVDVIKLDTDWEKISQESSNNIEIDIRPEGVAYIIYTSGSTGRPKGVLVTHQNVVSLVRETDYVSFNDQNILLSTGSSSFDATTFEYWGMLLNGGQLILCPESKLLDHELLKNEIQSRKVNMMWFTSSWFNQLVETDISLFETLKTILVGGEKLSQKHIEKLKQAYPSIEIINGYGPTENTTFSLTYNIKSTSDNISIPIGRPLNNRSAYVLNADQKLVPVGVAGEIYLGGSGVAKGYLNQEKLTTERFIKNPFIEGDTSKLYKTGDLGRWLPDGNIEYLGRIDGQVKIRGYRIELEEIEAVLLQSDLVKQAVVIAKEDADGDKKLVGYVVGKDAFEKEKIAYYLSSKLPDYMVPTFIVELDGIPLTSNGKVDKRALPDPEINTSSQPSVNPGNELEEKLIKVWLDVLKIDSIGINDDFFEMGGHSLLAIRLMSVLRKELGLEINIGDIFEYPTISTLAGFLNNQATDNSIPAIKAAPRPENIPLSFSQERLWFIDQMEGSVQYHIPALFRLKGNLNVDALSESLQTIINRHEALRTVFRKKDSNAYQYVQEKDLWELRLVDDIIYKKDDNLRNQVQQLIKEPFDLSKDHMLRATLIKLEDSEHLLLVTMHHIASDGWSMPVIVKEIASLYNSYDKGLPVGLPSLETQYADYAIWQRNYLQGELLDKKINYWKNKLTGVAALELPTDHQRPSVHTTRGEVKGFNISKELTDKLNALSQEEGVTLFMVLLASFKILLQRYSGQEDICVGIPIANRAQQEVNDLVGFFVNTLALRSNVDANVSFKEFLQKVKETTMEAYEHQDVPFEKVVEAVVKERDLSRSPLFQVMFVLQNTPDVPQLKLGDLILSAESYQHTTTKFDLSFSINENANGLRVSVNYSTDLYIGKTIERMFGHFEELLNAVIKAPQNKISQLRILTEVEEKQLLIDFNSTSENYPKDKSVIDLFEEQVIKSPGDIAVIHDHKEVTYEEINRRANQLARFLSEKGIKDEMMVPICIERSIEMIVGIMGVMKAGGAYVPIDPEYPKDRMKFMLDDTKATLILASKQTKERIPKGIADIIELDGEWQIIVSQTDKGFQKKITPHQLAYVIYTSGSTGKPKGVMIEHGGVVNLALSQAAALGLYPGMKTMQFASFGFDASCYEIFNTFLSGGTLLLPNKEDLLSIGKFADFITKNNVEVAVLPPSVQLNIKDVFGTLKTIISAGEPLNEVIAKHIQSKGIRLINAYGPTENTVCATLTDDPIKEDTISIGKPISNVRVYILDKSNSLCPVGVPGEICIAGSQVARGYLNRADLTAEKFIADPFDKTSNSKLYKSGDIGRWLDDGSVEYLGRIDDQVKLRGYRIELGEIENVLLQSGLINQTIVLAKQNNKGDKRLVGYVVEGDKDFIKEEVVAYLHSRLPEYMVPALWVEMEKFPLTPSGKIDKKALPDPDATALLSNDYIAPRNELEQKLVLIWQDLLALRKVGVYDNFFELGGHSLLAMRLLTAINNELQEEVLQIKDIFKFPTINELSKYLEIQLNTQSQEEDSTEFELIDL